MAKQRISVHAACLLVALSGAAARAQDDDVHHVKIYGGPAYVAPLDDSDVTLGTITDTVEEEDQVGWNFGIEGRFNKLVGLELDYVNANQDVTFGGTTIGDTTFSPLTATLNFHLIPTKVVDLYVGPSYTYVNWGDIRVNSSGVSITGGPDIRTDSEHGWGASLGLDIGLGKHFAICGGLKYLAVDLPTEVGVTTDVKPLVARLNAAFRF